MTPRDCTYLLHIANHCDDTNLKYVLRMKRMDNRAMEVSVSECV